MLNAFSQIVEAKLKLKGSEPVNLLELPNVLTVEKIETAHNLLLMNEQSDPQAEFNSDDCELTKITKYVGSFSGNLIVESP